jgi:hypothetical protein
LGKYAFYNNESLGISAEIGAGPPLKIPIFMQAFYPLFFKNDKNQKTAYNPLLCPWAPNGPWAETNFGGRDLPMYPSFFPGWREVAGQPYGCF